MKKIVTYGLIILVFLFIGQDVFGYVQFQPVLVFPKADETSVRMNEIFAYGSTDFKGNFLLCEGVPELRYADNTLIPMYQLTSDKYRVMYPIDKLSSSESVTSKFSVQCKLGLAKISPKKTFNLFSYEYYKSNYVVVNSYIPEDVFQEVLNDLDPRLSRSIQN